MTRVVKIPDKYLSKLTLLETETAIQLCKDYFESKLSEVLNLKKISAPILLPAGKGINDDLNGVEKSVTFKANNFNSQIEIVQSLAKWKRIAMAKYGFDHGEGLYTDMRAIRRDEVLDNLHSLYVDQWDWEKRILNHERNLTTLIIEVKKIYEAMKSTEVFLNKYFPKLNPILPNDIYFISSHELEKMYPSLSPKERENKISRIYGAVFIIGIGGALGSGEKHDDRSPDYDDWNLNGDLILWYPLLEKSIEISSMGIRVDKESLLKQLKITGNEERMLLEYHRAILSGDLPQTIGGGIGQSRLSMFFLKKAHIGEVQFSVWNDEIIKTCQEGNINLL